MPLRHQSTMKCALCSCIHANLVIALYDMYYVVDRTPGNNRYGDAHVKRVPPHLQTIFRSTLWSQRSYVAHMLLASRTSQPLILMTAYPWNIFYPDFLNFLWKHYIDVASFPTNTRTPAAALRSTNCPIRGQKQVLSTLCNDESANQDASRQLKQLP